MLIERKVHWHNSRKDEMVCECSDIDDIIVFTEEGKMLVVKVDSKVFVGKNIIHAAVLKRKTNALFTT